MNRVGIWITVIAAVAGLTMVALTTAGLRPLAPLSNWRADSGSSSSVIRVNNAHFVGRSDGRRTWDLRVGSVELPKDRAQARFRKISECKLYQDGRVAATLKTDELLYNMMSRDAHIPGMVTVSVIGGPRVRLHGVHWSGLESKMTCGGGVTAAMGRGVFQGRELVLDIRGKSLSVLGAKGRIEVE